MFWKKKPKVEKSTFSDPKTLAKAGNFLERFREVVADPVNLLINRVPEAGYVDHNNCVILHNGLRVPLRGPGSYYGNFSDLLIINRGVHEPLEEYCFQEMLSKLATPAPVMLELGAYWAHYSMWLKKTFPSSVCHMVESDEVNLEAGRANFHRNGLAGYFHQGRVSKGHFEVDHFIDQQALACIDILHADIQGFELEMIAGADATLSNHRAAYVFISTHSDKLHQEVEVKLRDYGYRIEISSIFSRDTTSFDGFIFASSPNQKIIVSGWKPLGRIEILHADPIKLVNSIRLRTTEVT